MGQVYAEVKIGNVSREKIVERRVLVDTGGNLLLPLTSIS